MSKIGICAGCGKEKRYANVHYKLCDWCNGKRLLQTPSKIRNEEKKQQKKDDLAEAYKEVDKREQACSGCGQTEYLSRSHIIARSRNRELIADENNIVWDCMQRIDGSMGCHSIWESGNIEKMITLENFEYRLEYLRLNDEGLYNQIKRKLDEL